MIPFLVIIMAPIDIKIKSFFAIPYMKSVFGFSTFRVFGMFYALFCFVLIFFRLFRHILPSFIFLLFFRQFPSEKSLIFQGKRSVLCKPCFFLFTRCGIPGQRRKKYFGLFRLPIFFTDRRRSKRLSRRGKRLFTAKYGKKFGPDRSPPFCVAQPQAVPANLLLKVRVYVCSLIL